jgi:putative membrane protein
LEEAVIYMKNQLSSAFLMSLLALSPVAVQAQDSSQHMDNGASKMMKSADAHFAIKAAQGGMAEVKMGQLAADKAGSPDVKAFGQQMMDDHTKANDQLKSIAKDEGMTLPGDVNQKQQAMYDRLSKLSGADFDKQYVKSMVMDHQEDVKDFQKEANSGKDEKIKSFASQTLPTLQQHLDKIRSIQSKMGSGSSM